MAITGMAINTPLGDTLDGFASALAEGRSAITHWKAVDASRIYSKVGGDLSGYDVEAKLRSMEAAVPPETYRRVRKLVTRSPWSTKLTVLLATEAYRQAGLFETDMDSTRIAALVSGHNLNGRHHYGVYETFQEEPDFIDSMFALNGLDTDHAGCVSEALGVYGPIYTMGAACASGNLALRAAVDEIRHHGIAAAVLVGPVLDFGIVELHAMALLGAISVDSFNDCPRQASRPFDVRREGFVPAHGGAALVLEPLEAAQRRGAHIYAEILGVDASADGSHLPQPSEEGQARLMAKVLHDAGVQPGDVDYVNAHATSTPLGDLTEIRSIKRVFGSAAGKLKINASKSMLGHTCWAAPVVETVAAVMQMERGELHPSINVDALDPEIDLDVCSSGPVKYDVRTVMKNSFGFGGINCVSLLRRFGD